MFRYSDQKGFVLFMVIFFMQILMLLSWYSIESTMLLKKFSQHIFSHDQLYYQAEGILSDIEHSILFELPSCMIPFTESGQLTEKPLSFWQSPVTCSGSLQSTKYYYVVEALTIDPCAIVENTKNSAAYFRITLFLLGANNAKIFLQSTIVRSGGYAQCKGPQHVVQLGRQSMRGLDY